MTIKSPLLQKNGFWAHLGDKRPFWYQNAEGMVDPMGVVLPMARALQAWGSHPAEFYAASMQMLEDITELSQNAWRRSLGMSAEALLEPADFDRRFNDAAWRDDPFFRNLMEQYLYLSLAFERIIAESPAMDHADRRKAAFWFRKYINALAPTNFLQTNPRAMKLAIESGGKSLLKGLELFLTDLQTRRLPLSDLSTYKVGKELAQTPGAVVYRNELVEVLHYTATTAQQRATPIVLITPWINKYYIVDLTPQLSLVKHLLDDGFDVYVTSWRNPGADMAETTMDDYLEQGISATIDTAIALSGSPEVHAAGYCIGGAALAMWMAIENARAKHEKRSVRVPHWTILATLVDYHYPGHIEVFIDPPSVDYLSDLVTKVGYLDGKSMSAAFRLLRSNNLIWEVAVRRYLYGQTGKPNEVLYWNMDSTRLPAAMYTWYLRELYLNNRLIVPNSLSLCGTPIDLGKIVQPMYSVGAKDDHITPWRSVAHINRLVPAPKRGVLSSSGHILGIINPPGSESKRSYRVGDIETMDNVADWEARSEERAGSWWPDWFAWLHQRTGPLVPAKPLTNKAYPKICAAPGTYVRATADHSAA